MKIMLILVFIMGMPELFGQSVDSLITEALANNPAVKKFRLKAASAAHRIGGAGAWQAPQAGIEFSQVPAGSLNVFNNALSNSLSLSQMIPLGGKPEAMSAAEAKAHEVELSNYDDIVCDIIAEVKMTVAKIWAAGEKIRLQQVSNKYLTQLIEILRTGLINGADAHADMLMLSSELASGEVQVSLLRKERANTLFQLQMLLGRKPEGNLPVVSDTLVRETPAESFEEILAVLSEENPEIQRMSAMIEMNRAMITANERELIPDLMVQGMFMRMPRGMILTSKNPHAEAMDEYMYSLMFSVTLPFVPWAKGKYESKSAELETSIAALEAEKEEMFLTMSAKVKALLNGYEVSAEKEQLYTEKILPAYRAAAEVQKNLLAVGKTTVTNVLATHKMLLMQEMDVVMAKADAVMALAELEMMTGLSAHHEQ